MNALFIYARMDRSKENFVSRENVEMLWELISDEDFMTIVREDELPNFQVRFVNDVKQFYQNEKASDLNLMDMNKKFVDNIFGYWRTKMTTTQTQTVKQQNYLPNIATPNTYTQNQNASNSMTQITAADIQNVRMKEFESQLAQKKNEFTSAMTHKIPDKPKFNDDMDTPIGEMEDLIAKTLAQRNFDISQIQMNIDKEKVETFLKSQDTSIKAEKAGSHKYNIDTSEVKFIKIGAEEVDVPITPTVDLLSSPLIVNDKKHISWADEENIKLNIDSTTYIGENNPTENSFFSKIKKRELNNEPKPKEELTLDVILKRIQELDNKMLEILSILKLKN